MRSFPFCFIYIYLAVSFIFASVFFKFFSSYSPYIIHSTFSNIICKTRRIMYKSRAHLILWIFGCILVSCQRSLSLLRLRSRLILVYQYHIFYVVRRKDINSRITLYLIVILIRYNRACLCMALFTFKYNKKELIIVFVVICVIIILIIIYYEEHDVWKISIVDNLIANLMPRLFSYSFSFHFNLNTFPPTHDCVALRYFKVTENI